ncbi:MAG: TMEM175 family protein [Bryobacteraceae bacterium]
MALTNSRSHNTEEAYPDTGRIEAFSDGVFAVAVTLLVFNIKLPEQVAAGQLGRMLLSQWPSFAAYVVSFITVGIFWANHHYMFHYIERSNHLLGMINVLFLMCISFLPFSTSLMASFIRNPNEQRTAVLIYVGTFLACALLFGAVWLYAAQGRRLLDKNLDPVFIRRLSMKYRAGSFSYLVAFALAFWSITLSLAIVVALAIVFFFPTGHSAHPQTISDPGGFVAK